MDIKNHTMKPTSSILTLFLVVCSFCYSQNIIEIIKEEYLDLSSSESDGFINLDSIQFSASSELLDEEVYWEIIERSLTQTNNQEDQELFLIAEIEKLSLKEMIGFRLRTDKLLFDSYNSNLWCASYIINNGITEDGFEYFRCWLISRDRDVYFKTMASPEYLIEITDIEKQSYDFEGFWYVATNAFKNKTNEDFYSYIDYETFKTNDENYPLLEFNWNPEEPLTMKKICPLLFEKYNKI